MSTDPSQGNANELPQVGLSEPAKPEDARVRTRGVAIALLAVVAVVLAIGGVVVATQDDDEPGTATVDDSVLSAPCGEPISRETDRSQEHVSDLDLRYADAPPSFGRHFAQWQSFERAFYGADRPPVSVLVHNLEHGYTIVWYDQTAAADEDAMNALRDLAADYESDRERFLAVPWTAEDGAPFPDDMHVAVTRWTADPTDPGNTAEQRGNWLYCGGVDADAIGAFYDTFPNAQSPEPGIPVE